MLQFARQDRRKFMELASKIPPTLPDKEPESQPVDYEKQQEMMRSLAAILSGEKTKYDPPESHTEDG